MSNEDIIKFINDNCRHCSGEGFDDIIDDCHECPLLKKCMTEEDNPMEKVLANLFDGIRDDT